MKTAHYVLLIGMSMAAGLPAAQAQLEVGGSNLDNCGQIDSLRQAGNLTEARQKAQICLDALDQELAGALGNLFPASVAGWTQSNIDQSQALGFTNISATYRKDNVSANVSLTGGTSGSGLGGLLGGIARSGLFGQAQGRQVRVGGLPASVQPDGSIMVTLEDGSFLTFQSSSYDSADAALEGIGDLVNGFPVAEINSALK